MRTFAFDPGGAYGVAVCEDGTIVYSQQGAMKAADRLAQARRVFIDLEMRYPRPDCVVVEQPAILGRGTSFDSLAGQWANVFAWWHAAELSGLAPQWVNPASWRALMVKAVKATLRPGEDAKTVLQLPQAELTERALGYPVGNDECAACWMALWACANAESLTPEARKTAKKEKAAEKKAARDRKQDRELDRAVATADELWGK